MRSEKRGGEPLYEPCRPKFVGRPLTEAPLRDWDVSTGRLNGPPRPEPVPEVRV